MALGIYNGIASDNAQNLVPVEVQNSKSLAFDGSDQHLTTTADSTLATKTYSFWAQSSGVSGNGNTVFSHGDNTLGAFHLNWYSSNSLVILDSDYYQYFNSTSKSTDGDWHHWLVFIDHTDVTACRVFCDGEELGKGSSNTAGSADSYSTGITIGKAASSEHFSGHLDEFAIFDGDKTDIVADLYNNGVPSNLSGYAKLDHWWRMGDATEPDADGTSDLIFDQQDKTLGSELVTNGGFSSDSDWTKGTGWTISSSAASCDGSQTGASACQQSASFTTGAVYEVTYDLTVSAGSFRVRLGGGSNVNGITRTTSGSYTDFLTAVSGNDKIMLLAVNATFVGSVDNVSVKKLNGASATMNNMATSDMVQYTPNSYILSDLGITPDLAVSMTRKLVSDYSGSFYATSGSDVTTIYDQSGNSRNLTNYGSGDEVTLSGSGNLARAVFSSISNSVLTTDTLGSAFPAGNHDVFMVFDPVGTDQQILFGRASTGGDFLAMDNGSSSNASNGITIGEIRVNDAVLSATVTRNALWDAMTVAGTMSGLNVLSLEDVDLSTIGGHIRLGASNNTWRLEGYFAEFIITPPLTDAEHSAVVENIRAHYDAP